MSVTSSFAHAAKQPRIVIGLCLVALAVCSWSAFQYSRWAPVQSHIDQGAQLQNAGRTEEARKEWLEVVRLDPNNVQAWQFLGDFYLQQKNYPEAQKAFENVLRIAPNTPDLKARLAVTSYGLKDKSKALTFAKSELKTNLNSITALEVEANVERYVHPDVMLNDLRRLSKLQPQDEDALNTLIAELQTRDAYDEIIPLANRLVQLAPDSSHSYECRGIALYTVNPNPDSLTRAKQDLQKALQLDSGNVEAHRYLGRLYLRQNQPRLAIAEFEAVGKGRPYASAHLLELSQAYRRAGNKQRADEIKAKFTSLRELNTRWIGLNERIKRDTTNADNCIQMVSLLLQRALGSDASVYHLYSFQVARGKMLSIQEYLETASQRAPQNSKVAAAKKQADAVYNAYIEAGRQDIKAGQFAQANEAVARAFLIYPANKTTLQLARQVSGAGFDPFPAFSPEAVTDAHHR